jgi:hypothetical protein
MAWFTAYLGNGGALEHAILGMLRHQQFKPQLNISALLILGRF